MPIDVPLIIPLSLATGAVFLIVLALGVSTGVFEVVTRSFWCPFRQRSVTARFEEAVWDGKRVNVATCSVFSPATAVGCDKACLTLSKLTAKPKAKGPESGEGGPTDPWRRNRTDFWAP
jgi:hypothetical protein